MILEVLQADKGDCLMLHTEDGGSPALILIDGGPAGVSEDSLIPRLEELREERIESGSIGRDDPLVIDLLIVSHIDDDHINGIIDLLEQMQARKTARQPARFKIKDLWHNSFDRILGNDETGQLLASSQFGAASTAALVEEAAEGESTDAAKVLASIEQGDRLKGLAASLGIPVNGAFGGKLIQTIPGQSVTRKAAGIEFEVLGPREPQLKKLQRDYDRWLRDQPPSERTAASLLAAIGDDKSVANLSSIVLLARKDGRSIMLTGDAHSDMILLAMEEARLIEAGGELPVTILKMPHHGSVRNVKQDFLRQVPSGHYVFSGNGKHSNPDRETFDLLFGTRPGAPMLLYLTYTIASIDPVRKAIHDREADKGRLPPWSDAANSLAAVLSPPPPGVQVIVHDDSLLQIEPSATT